jgi:hypothetical protein
MPKPWCATSREAPDFGKRLRDRRCGKSFNEVMDEAGDHGDDGTTGAGDQHHLSRGLRTWWSRLGAKALRVARRRATKR